MPIRPGGRYRDKSRAGKRGAEFKYPCMKTSDICSVPVADLADTNCSLFCWATMPNLPEAFKVIKAWGFTYKTCAFTWIKMNKKATDTVFWGGGHYTRANSELCLLATKGKPKRISASIHSVIMSPVRDFSRKPDEARDRIVGLMGDVPRIELFARDVPPGWDAIGDEIDGIGIHEKIRDLTSEATADIMM